jgi:HipA-like C-terminal domain
MHYQGDFYQVVEISPEWLTGMEPMGSKTKRWIRLPSDEQPWLFKYSRHSAGQVTGEHWAEKIAAEVAEVLGVIHPPVELARLEGQWGSISRRFDELSSASTELVHGNDLLAGHVTGYDPQKKQKQSDHTLDNVIRVIEWLFPSSDGALRRSALVMLAGYLILDGLILNTDRHHENWGVLRRIDWEQSGVHYSIAPSFDHASSLARNEPPEKLSTWLLEPWRVSWYAMRGPGGLYWRESDPRGANPLQLAIDAAAKWPAYFEPWRQRLANLRVDLLTVAIDRVPDEAMAVESKRFAKALVAHTLDRLKTI